MGSGNSAGVRNISILSTRLETETYEDISLRKDVGFLKALLIRLISRNPPFSFTALVRQIPRDDISLGYNDSWT